MEDPQAEQETIHVTIYKSIVNMAHFSTLGAKKEVHHNEPPSPFSLLYWFRGTNARFI